MEFVCDSIVSFDFAEMFAKVSVAIYCFRSPFFFFYLSLFFNCLAVAVTFDNV